MKMPFGKYRGQLVENLSEQYVSWLLNQGFVKGKLKLALVATLNYNGPSADDGDDGEAEYFRRAHESGAFCGYR